jgi:hypothetical protein
MMSIMCRQDRFSRSRENIEELTINPSFYMMFVIYNMEAAMALESQVNPGATSWLGRLWQNFTLLAEAIELSDAERLERRVAVLEAAASNASERVE